MFIRYFIWSTLGMWTMFISIMLASDKLYIYSVMSLVVSVFASSKFTKVSKEIDENLPR